MLALTPDRIMRIWKWIAALYWAGFALLWIPIARDLFSFDGFIPKPEYGFSQAHQPWLRWEWMTTPVADTLPFLLLTGAALLVTRWDRVGALLIWLVSVIMMKRNNMLESAEWPLWGILFLSWGLFSLRSLITAWCLWITHIAFTVLIVSEQFSEGAFIFRPGLRRLLEGGLLTRPWVESLFGFHSLWISLSLLVAFTHLSSLFLIWGPQWKNRIVLAVASIHVGSLFFLDFPQISLGLLIWTLALPTIPPLRETASALWKRPRLVAVATLATLLIWSRPASLLGSDPTPGWSKSWMISPLQYPFGNPYANEGYQRRVTITLHSENGMKNLFNDRWLFNELREHSRLRIFIFNTLGTIHRLPPELSRQVFVRAFCNDGRLLHLVSPIEHISRIEVRRGRSNGDDFHMEVSCSN